MKNKIIYKLNKLYIVILQNSNINWSWKKISKYTNTIKFIKNFFENKAIYLDNYDIISLFDDFFIRNNATNPYNLTQVTSILFENFILK